MSPEAAQVEKKRYLRQPKVVFVKPLNDNLFLVTDLDGKNEYTVSKEVMEREYKEI